MKMKKCLALLLALVLCAGTLAGCGGKSDSAPAPAGKAPDSSASSQEPAAQPAADPVIVKIGYENNPGEPIDQACNAWAEYLSELSGGTMEMQCYPSSQLGAKNDIIDQMLAGDNVITLADGAFLADRGAPDMGIQFAPFLFDTYDEAWKLVESDWWEKQSAICRENGLVPNFTTSGYGLTPELAAVCRKYCGAVAVSWYRSTYTHNAVRMLLDAGVKTNIHYVLGQTALMKP